MSNKIMDAVCKPYIEAQKEMKSEKKIRERIMGNKSKVLAVYPNAFCYWSQTEQKYLVWSDTLGSDTSKLIGKGDTPMWAWAIANEFLTKENKSELYE